MPPADELDFLRWLEETDRPDPSVAVPVGDDAAVVRLGGASVVIAADAIAEGSHFLESDDPRLVGRKALAVNLSDLAAMGAEPVCAVATAALPRGFDLLRAQAMTDGMRALGATHSCPLVGGDTVTHDGGAVLSVTVLGRPMGAAAVLRAGAKPGDVIMITGAIGGSRHGRHLTFDPRLPEARYLVEATSRLAMIDVSDGLLLDLARLTRGLGFRLDAGRIPLHPDASDLDTALEEGEDFELLCAVDAADVARLGAGWAFDATLTAIGQVTETGSILVVDGTEHTVEPRGFRHE